MREHPAQLRIGIIGCGLIGRKRANALGPDATLTACSDAVLERAEALAKPAQAQVYADWRELIDRDDIDIVIVATPHDALAGITLAAIQTGKHVLVEKPAARSTAELVPAIDAADKAGVRVHAGFNHRYHRSLRKAREIVSSGALGELMMIRGRYGHGGRLGYDKEWRADPIRSGGGELIDQGSHLIDLSRWFLGDFSNVQGFAHTYYWDMPVDDNGFLLLRTRRQQTAFLHASCTEWKNLFSFEIYGRDGKLDLSGLGGSYGVERIAWYRMLPEMGPPETFAWEYPMADNSWSVEMAEFFAEIREGRATACSLRDAYAVLAIIETIYKESGYDHCA